MSVGSEETFVKGEVFSKTISLVVVTVGSSEGSTVLNNTMQLV